MAVRRTTICLICIGFLGGCASSGVVEDTGADTAVDRHIANAARKIELAQVQLYRVSGLPTPAGGSGAGKVDQRIVTVAWHGDASQLIRRLAEERGLRYTQMGVRMPLPVAIDVTEEPLEQVLDRIRSQVGYRAVVDEKPDALVLLYNRPLP